MQKRFQELEQKLLELAANSNHNSARFFKQGVGEYAQHDIFVHIKNPDLRKLVKEFKDIAYEDILKLLQSPYNEYRLLALLFLVDRYQKGSVEIKNKICATYLENIAFINNWNLVDSSAHLIVGAHMYHGFLDQDVVLELVRSDNLWGRRVAIISSWYFIRHKSFDLTLTLSEKLLQDKEDLIHKAVGWMLREIGKKDQTILKDFLNRHVSNMPRTMLRYSIEHFDVFEYNYYLKK